MESPVAIAGPPPTGLEQELRRPPPPLHGGPLVLLRFMRRHGMLTPKYARLVLRLLRRRFLSSYGRRLKLDAPDVAGRERRAAPHE